MKVINSLGAGHIDLTRSGPLKAAEAYRLQQREHLATAQRCADNGIHYAPLVFTTQGGMERHAEAAVSQLADAVAKAESRDPVAVKAEIPERLALCIARSVSSSIQKRSPLALTPW